MFLFQFADPCLVFLFDFIIIFLKFSVFGCQCFVLFGLLEHFFVGSDLDVGDGDFPLLHHVVLEGLDLDAVLGAHHLDCLDVFLVLGVSGLGELCLQGFDPFTRYPL